jgi:hypothetical protein
VQAEVVVVLEVLPLLVVAVAELAAAELEQERLQVTQEQ